MTHVRTAGDIREKRSWQPGRLPCARLQLSCAQRPVVARRSLSAGHAGSCP